MNRSLLSHYVDTVKYGYDNLSWIFNIVGVGILIGTQLGIAATGVSIMLGLALFYYGGLVHKKISGHA